MERKISLLCITGHVNFSDEATAAFRLCDGVVIFIDAAEGVSPASNLSVAYDVMDLQMRVTY